MWISAHIEEEFDGEIFLSFYCLNKQALAKLDGGTRVIYVSTPRYIPSSIIQKFVRPHLVLLVLNEVFRIQNVIHQKSFVLWVLLIKVTFTETEVVYDVVV